MRKINESIMKSKNNLTKTVSAVLMGVMIFSTAVSGVSAAELHPATLEWDDIEVVNANLDDVPMAPSLYKSKVDLTTQFPTPGNQGSQGSCTAWAVAYALKSSQENVKRGWTVGTDEHTFSPAYVYNQLTRNGSGIHISEAMKLLVNQGVCSLKYFPYDDSTYTTKPSEKMIGAASLYKSSYWSTIKGVTTIKNHLAAGNGVVIGVQVFPDFDEIDETNQVYDNSDGISRGAHAICLIGYDDSKKAFKFMNSWGDDWGLNGYGWISYDLVNDSKVNHYNAAIGYVMGTATDDYLLGDVDENGIINSSDAFAVLQIAAGGADYTYRQYALGDVNGDTIVNSADANLILNYASNSLTKFPIYE